MNNEFIRIEHRAEFPSRGVRQYWAVAAGCALFAVLVARFDIQAASFNRFGDLPGDLRRVLRLSEFFAHGFGIVVVGCGIWCLVSYKRHYIPRIIICAIWPGIVAYCVKLFVTRIRPGKLVPQFPEISQDTFHCIWTGIGSELNWVYDFQSFPSGHTATVVGLAIGLTWAFPRGKYFFFSLAALAAMQRITSGAHWLSDVAAGVAIAVLFAGAVTQNWGIGYWLGLWEQRSIEKLLNRGVISRMDPTLVDKNGELSSANEEETIKSTNSAPIERNAA